MGIPEIDYTSEQVKELRVFMEQYVKYEPFPELKKTLHIIRALDDIGAGTTDLSFILKNKQDYRIEGK